VKRAIIIRPAAQCDIDEHAAYIAQDSSAAGRRFLHAVREVFQDLLRMPKLGRTRESPHPRLAGVRVQIVPGFRKYLIFYRPVGEGIEILHVFHGARDIKSILDDQDDDG